MGSLTQTGRMPPANYFIAIKITNEQVISKIEGVQTSLIEHLQITRWTGMKPKSVFGDVMLPPEELYLILNSMHLKEDGQMETVGEMMTDVGSFVEQKFRQQPMQLTFEGLGKFGERVLHAKIKEQDSTDFLKELRDLFQGKLNYYLDLPLSSKPHLPLLAIANISRSEESQKKGFRSFPPSICEQYEDTQIGTEIFNGFQLYKINATNDYDFL